MTHPFDLEGRVALVTGAGGGIGRALVTQLLGQGATVAFTYVDGVENAEKLLAEFDAPSDRISAHPLDLRNVASIRSCFASVIEAHGGVDILVNNAAVGSATVAMWSDDPDVQDSEMLGINADGTLKMCLAFLEAPGKPARKLVNVSSVGGGIAAFSGFRLSDGMSKAAVAFLTRQLAAEAVHTDVDVFAVCPGATNTPMFQASTLNGMSAEELKVFLAGLPKGRLIEPEEIATIIGFLAGPASTVMNGAVIDASMGLGVRPGLMTEGAH